MLQLPISPSPSARKTIARHLQKVQEIVHSRYPAVTRIAIAIYDAESEELRPYSSSNIGTDPLLGYAKPLREVPSLEKLARGGLTRVVENIQHELADASLHSCWLREQGFVCSLAKPLFFGDSLVGFLFFDAVENRVFDEGSLDYFSLISKLAVELYFSELSIVNLLRNTMKIAHDMVHLRDVETGLHLERVALFSRAIASRLASPPLDDEFIEHLSLFASLHDIGKIAIPDSILLKPGKLTDEEYTIIKTHVDIGAQVIDRIVADLGAAETNYVRMMRNVILGHHECIDGSGYPRGLKGDEIPLEARIVSVADIFDALTCRRLYRAAWPNEHAFAELARLVETGKLDRACVAALTDCQPEIERIQADYAD